MKPNEFFKVMGINAVKQFLENDNIRTKEMHDDLKRLVKSHELVELYGGLDKAKIRCYPAKHVTMESYRNLKQAIADVESCQ